MFKSMFCFTLSKLHIKEFELKGWCKRRIIYHQLGKKGSKLSYDHWQGHHMYVGMKFWAL